MKLSPQKFRETVLLILFSKDFHDSDEQQLAVVVDEELKVGKGAVAEAQSKVYDILQHLIEIDAAIAKSSISYDFHRIGRVEKNILRLALYELKHEKICSKSVVIAEAKRLAKKFSTPESAVFCQAMVDALAKQSV